MPVNTNRWNRIRYAAMAPFYDLIAGFQRQRARSVCLLGLGPGEDVLLLGAGTGADLPFLPRTVSVTAVDITPAMVERVRRRASALQLAVDARIMDGQQLTFPDESFDAVILHLILAVIPDPVACIREAERVLRPGGRAVIFDKFAPDGQRPSLWRHLLNVLTNFLFSDITRQLRPLLGTTSLRVEHLEAAAFGGAYQIVVIRKPESVRK